MLDNLPILTLLLLSPLVGILVILFIPSQHGHRLKTVAIIASILPLIFAMWLFVAFDHGQPNLQFTEDVLWIEIPLDQTGVYAQEYASLAYQFHYHLSADGLSAALLLLTAFLASMAMMAAVHVKKRWKAFYSWMFLLEFGMLGVFMARDLLLFFVFFELTLVPVFFLIGIWGLEQRKAAANRFLLYNGIGSAFMLLAFILLIHTAGFTVIDAGAQSSIIYSGSLDGIMNNLTSAEGPSSWFQWTAGLQWTIMLLLLLAFGIKLPFFPFHSWMLHVHREAPAAVVMLHAGVMLKMGAYGMIRFGIMLLPEHYEQLSWLLAVLGLMNLLYGALLAFMQTEFRLILAYASISHMGIVLLGLASYHAVGLNGALFQIISHGLITALLFLLVGSLFERTKTTSLSELGGIAQRLPFMSGMLLAGGLALLGLPSLSGFVGELLAFLGIYQRFPVVAVVSAFGILLTAAYVLRGILTLTYGPLKGLDHPVRDARFIEALPMILLMAFIVLIGVYPAVLTEMFQHALYPIVTQIGG